MLELLLIALAGTATVGLLDIIGNEEGEQPLPEDDTGDGVEVLYADGPRFTDSVTGLSHFFGGAGDDTLPGGQEPPSRSIVSLEDGDDSALVDTSEFVGVIGGDGEDTLVSTNVATGLAGGNDDDVLIGVTGNSLDGGSGDDIITYDSDAFSYKGTSTDTAFGGDGDDILNIFATVSESGLLDPSAVRVEGGEGADTHNIFLEVMGESDQAQPDITGEPPVVVDDYEVIIAGFDPFVDSLSIDVLKIDGSLDVDNMQVDFNQESESAFFDFATTLQFYFSNDTLADPIVGKIKIFSSASFTLEDISIRTQDMTLS